MGKITDLNAQKRPGRISVFVDGKYAVGLSLWQVADLKLRIGQELSKEDVLKLKDDAIRGKLYDMALAWLVIRKRSEWEVRTYLYKKTTDEQLREDIFNRLNKAGYIDDQAFAVAWVENRRRTKMVSKRRLEQELRAKRLADEDIKHALSLDEVENSQVLVGLIAKKRKMTRYQDDDKLLQYLARQGFSYGEITEALSLS